MYKFLFLFFTPFFLSSQNQYSVDSIPLSLKENIDAVIRLQRTDFIIKDISSAILKKHVVVTVFNARGAENYLRFYTYYSNLSRVKDISGVIYDKNGGKIYKLSKKDFYDVSENARSNEVSDSRIKIAEFGNKSFSFPYTIDFFSSVETKNMMFYPSECFYTYEHISTQEKSIIIETPLDFSFWFKEKNMPNKVNIITEGNKKIYTWIIKNISSKEYEPFIPFDIYPEVLTAPKEFIIEDYQGDIESWNDIGKFISKLNIGRDTLPDYVKLKVKELIQNEKDTLKRIYIIYNYLQNTTRYMSIQLGIGGWQTMTAKEVANKGYGDCKALSNYMKALLKEAGITSYIALIKSGSNEESIENDFPMMNFNHVINCVLLRNDTIWLECTSQTNALGYQGSFTGNRKALLILPEGGQLVNTCKYGSHDNTQIRKSTISIDELGNAKAHIKTIYKGIEQEGKNFILNEKNSEQQKKLMQNTIPIASFELEKFSLLEKKSRIPTIEEDLDLSILKLLNKTGSMFFIKPNMMHKEFISLLDNKERKLPFYLNPNIFNREEYDSLIFYIPLNFKPEFILEPILLKSKFGEYSITLNFKNGVLVYIRKLILNDGYFSAKDYQDWIDFIKKINKNDKLQLALRIKTE